MSDKLNIRNEMARLDSKDRDFYYSLNDEERKKFGLFLMIRWSSTVGGTRELQEYYVQSCNHYLNKHFFTVNRHPQLQWLMATAVSPGTGNHTHSWIKPKSKEKGSNDVKKTLMKLYPNMKISDIEAMATINDSRELKAYEREHGN